MGKDLQGKLEAYGDFYMIRIDYTDELLGNVRGNIKGFGWKAISNFGTN